jgi:hypothetical protein
MGQNSSNQLIQDCYNHKTALFDYKKSSNTNSWTLTGRVKRHKRTTSLPPAIANETTTSIPSTSQFQTKCTSHSINNSICFHENTSLTTIKEENHNDCDKDRDHSIRV